MHPRQYAEMERVCAARGAGGAVLEIGAVPSEDSLLCMSCLAAAVEKIGISLDGPSRYRDFEILNVNSNAMDCFPDRRFDTVLCNSTLEHDLFFWKTLAEIRRVAKPGALVVIGVPGYAEAPAIWKRILRVPGRLPVVGSLVRRQLDPLLASTPTLAPHYCPGDYYRFGRQAVEQILCAGLRAVEIRMLLRPPRFIGSGIMPE
jgi:SAM-dependent methyltransferase